ncbi:MAG TPA: Uma2 family endonuclease [Kofleriaceae bacterium]|nr:Uma2 family endonuclease [Kofleriaceae bacterium]
MATRKATAEDLRAAYGEDGRAEVIHGEILPKVAPMAVHGRLEMRVLAALSRRFDRSVGDRWPGGWWLGTEIHVIYEPHELYCHDGVGWRRDRCPAPPAGWPVELRPDWVLEILSPGHERRDRFDKWRTLHRAGVPHYWIIDHETRTLEVHRWHPDGYLSALVTAPGEAVRAEPFDAVELRVAVLFGDEDDDE